MNEIDHFLQRRNFHPNLKIKTLGGTGNTHNWEISKSIVTMSKIPVWLAGGLNPENVQKAIETVQPYGVDLCSGVRTNGNLNGNKLLSFFDKVRIQTQLIYSIWRLTLIKILYPEKITLVKMIALGFTNVVFFSYVVYLIFERKKEVHKSKLFWLLLLGLFVSLYITSLFLFEENNTPIIIGL